MISLETELTVERLLRLASPRLGPLTQIRTPATWPGVDKNFLTEAEMCDSTVFGGQTLGRSTVGFGQGPNPSIAMIKALAEALERYGAGLLPSGANQQKATYNEISSRHHVWPLEDLQILRPHQQNIGRYRRLEATDSVHWVRGQELGLNGTREIWHPACFLTLNRKYAFPFDVGTTSGFAVGPSFESAAASALCEILERDCFASAWWTGKSPYPVFKPKDVWSLLPIHIRQSIREADAPFYYIVDMTSKWGIPVFILLFLKEEPEPCVVLAASSGIDARKALAHGLGEGSRILNFHRRARKQLLKDAPKPPYETSVINFHHHIAFGTTADAVNSHRFFTQGPHQVPEYLFNPAQIPESAEQRLRFLVEQIQSHGSQAAIFDFTPIDLQREGFSLVRAKIRHAIPIECAFAAKPLGSPALRDIPLEKLNINPSCFP